MSHWKARMSQLSLTLVSPSCFQGMTGRGNIWALEVLLVEGGPIRTPIIRRSLDMAWGFEEGEPNK